jgi:protein-tyrosine phosphatase
MVDIHSHILYELDDGPKTLEDCMQMIYQAIEAGIEVICTTPHFHEISSYDRWEALRNRFNEIRAQVAIENLDIEILLGSEIYVFPGLENLPLEYATLNGTYKYLLIELPMTSKIPVYWEDTMFKLLVSGITPIIAHPERYMEVIKNIEIVDRWIHLGALIQVDSGSLVGGFGDKVKSIAWEIIRRRWLNFVASDAHDMRFRTFTLSKKAYQELSDKIGEEFANKWMKINPGLVVEGKEIVKEEKKDTIAEKMLDKFFNTIRFVKNFNS